MDFKWLEDFLAICDTHSFSRAADLRGVTQSAFSRRIRALEDWMGAELVNRDSFPVTLTPEGRSFRETAEEAVRMIHARRAEFRHQKDSGPVIALVALHSLTVTFLPHWLTQLREALGPVATRVKPENYDRCLEAISEGGYDFFLTFHHDAVPTPLDARHFPHLVVGHDALVAVARPNRPALWAAEGEAMPLLQYSRGSFLGLMAAIAQAQPGAPRVYVAHTNEASMAEAMKSMAVEGHGLCWLPRGMVAAELADGRLTVVGPELPLQIRLYRNAARGRGLTNKVWAAAEGYSVSE